MGGVGVLRGSHHAHCSRTEAVSHPTCPGFDAPLSPPRWQEGKQAVGWVIGVSGDAGHSANAALVVSLQQGAESGANHLPCCLHSLVRLEPCGHFAVTKPRDEACGVD